MRQPYEKFIMLELIAIGIAILLGTVALLKGYVMILLLAFYLVTCSMICGALMEWSTRQTTPAMKHFVQAGLLFAFITFMLFHI